MSIDHSSTNVQFGKHNPMEDIAMESNTEGNVESRIMVRHQKFTSANSFYRVVQTVKFIYMSEIV